MGYNKGAQLQAYAPPFGWWCCTCVLLTYSRIQLIHSSVASSHMATTTTTIKLYRHCMVYGQRRLATAAAVSSTISSCTPYWNGSSTNICFFDVSFTTWNLNIMRFLYSELGSSSPLECALKIAHKLRENSTFANKILCRTLFLKSMINWSGHFQAILPIKRVTLMNAYGSSIDNDRSIRCLLDQFLFLCEYCITYCCVNTA